MTLAMLRACATQCAAHCAAALSRRCSTQSTYLTYLTDGTYGRVVEQR